MLDNHYVARCVRCNTPYSPKELRLPVRESDAYGQKGKIVAFNVYPTGCQCGEFYREEADERPGYRLNILPSWKKMERKR